MKKKKDAKEKRAGRRLLDGFLKQARKQTRQEKRWWKRPQLWVWVAWLHALAWAADATWKKLLGVFLLFVMALTIIILLPQQKSVKYGLDHTVDIESADFLPSITSATGALSTSGNKIEALTNGDQFYPAMLQAISQAQRSITLQAFIFWGGDIGQKFADALVAKARAGVQVKLLLDSVGSNRYNYKVIRQLEDGGCQIGWFHPVRLLIINRFDNRTHRDSLVIDGRVGFTGGVGVADHWAGNAEDPKHWRDTQVRIEGPAVLTLQTGFSLRWLETTGEMMSGPAYFPSPEQAGTLSIHTVLSEPETRSSPARILYFLSIMSARKSILIGNPYFVPDNEAIRLMREAERRGVDVKVMVAGDHNDQVLARRNSSRLYGELLEAGVEIYEYNRTMMHHKYMVCDGVWSTIGSINFDNLSFTLSDEGNVGVYDRAFAAQLEQMFQRDLEACNRIELEEWRNRGIGVRAIEWFSALFKRVV